ncbi:transmembrane protease serine 3-like [Glandiceps talaboti]
MIFIILCSALYIRYRASNRGSGVSTPVDMFRLLLTIITLWYFLFEVYAAEKMNDVLAVDRRTSKVVEENKRDLAFMKKLSHEKRKTTARDMYGNSKVETFATVGKSLRAIFLDRIRKRQSLRASSSPCAAQEFECRSGRRLCIPGNWECDGLEDCVDGFDEENCEKGTGWSEWTRWGECNVDCGTGEHSRSRHCLNSEAEGCEGEDVEYTTCHLKPCYEEAENGCGTRVNPAQPRIVGGEDALPGEWPWQAQLYFIPDEELHCGGTLIGPRHILTASHCFNVLTRGFVTKNWKVRLGKYRRDGKSGKRDKSLELNIARIIPYANYSYFISRDNDIAIVELEKDVIPTNSINYACLNTKKEAVFDGHSYCFTTGWGFWKLPNSADTALYEEDELIEMYTPKVLQEAMVPLIPHDICNAPSSYGGALTSNMMCAGYLGGGIDSCQGDSGGPLVCLHQNSDDGLGHWYLVGVVSGGEGCADANHPGVYTNVDNYLEWIRNEGGMLVTQQMGVHAANVV